MSERKLEGPQPATAITPFQAPSEYNAAWDKLVPLAATELLIFDRDLRDGGWSALARNAALRDFLMGNRASRLQIIVHEITYIEGFLPRMVLLLRDFSYRIQILRTVADGRRAWDAFAIVDGRHILHRFHQDVMRGELALHAPVKARELRERFDEILQFTEPGVNATQLGL
ncbi:MAG: hypothetical protein ABJB04_07485 [Betaproteobacteria bacterium]